MKKVISTLIVGSICVSTGMSMDMDRAPAGVGDNDRQLAVAIIMQERPQDVSARNIALLNDVLREYKSRTSLQSNKDALDELIAANDSLALEEHPITEWISKSLMEKYLEIVIQEDISSRRKMEALAYAVEELHMRVRSIEHGTPMRDEGAGWCVALRFHRKLHEILDKKEEQRSLAEKRVIDSLELLKQDHMAVRAALDAVHPHCRQYAQFPAAPQFP